MTIIYSKDELPEEYKDINDSLKDLKYVFVIDNIETCPKHYRDPEEGALIPGIGRIAFWYKSPDNKYVYYITCIQ